MIQKHSISIRGHRTSVSLEKEFWDSLQTIARSRGQTFAALMAEIDEQRQPDVNLSSAARVYALGWFKQQSLR